MLATCGKLCFWDGMGMRDRKVSLFIMACRKVSLQIGLEWIGCECID